ncbi:MAG: putative sulfate exporter family transporter [Gammaproteobacteria bacterium]|nr:putative sulfate exporter family transporter [Gammaproteobacteria bacterium]
MANWTEDTAAILLGFFIIALALVVFLIAPFDTVNESLVAAESNPGFSIDTWSEENNSRNAVATFFSETVNGARPSRWSLNPFAVFSVDFAVSAVLFFVFLGLLFGVGSLLMQRNAQEFLKGFGFIFVISLVAYMLANQTEFRSIGLGYALWAILLGLVISNIFGIPDFIRPALQPELYIKTGLVLLGAEVLFGKILAIGLPGIFVSWIVTPIVLISTFWFGQKVLKISSKTLNITISADMSVCGVSAAIATAAACRATKEELTTAVGLSMIFTSIMMVAMPAFINAVGMPEVLGGAWIGGTIDATGAVVAAGAFLGDIALNVAATIKMIQNILIGVLAFGVAVYWTTKVDKAAGRTVGASEIWLRFPKFVLGFLGASILLSLLYEVLNPATAIVLVENGVLDFTSDMRGWVFCLAFASIGLSANFRELRAQFHGGKPLILYVCGQTLNLCLTLLMAWVMFYKVFPEITNSL